MRPEEERAGRKTSRGGPSWRRGAALLAVSVVAVFGLPSLVLLTNAVKIAGFPLGYYWAAQGAVLALVAVAFLYAAGGDPSSEPDRDHDPRDPAAQGAADSAR